MNSGSTGADPSGLTTNEYDAYSLLAISPNLPKGGPGAQSPTLDIRPVGADTFLVPAGFCSGQDSFAWVFAVNTWERQEHLMPVHHYACFDVNQDGTDDYAVFNSDLSGSTTHSDGRHATFAQNLATGSASAFFFTEHSMNTGNTVLYICGEQDGLIGTDMLVTNVDMDVYAQDWYYAGPGDWVTGVPEDMPGKSEGAMTGFDFGPFPGNSAELGVMPLTDGDRGGGARGSATQDTEAILFSAP